MARKLILLFALWIVFLLVANGKLGVVIDWTKKKAADFMWWLRSTKKKEKQ